MCGERPNRARAQEYLALGEVPTTVRSTFMQKSRWCKGGMQIFFSRHNAMLAPNLTFMQKVIWNTSGWAYICTTVTTPVFQARRPRPHARGIRIGLGLGQQSLWWVQGPAVAHGGSSSAQRRVYAGPQTRAPHRLS